MHQPHVYILPQIMTTSRLYQKIWVAWHLSSSHTHINASETLVNVSPSLHYDDRIILCVIYYYTCNIWIQVSTSTTTTATTSTCMPHSTSTVRSAMTSTLSCGTRWVMWCKHYITMISCSVNGMLTCNVYVQFTICIHVYVIRFPCPVYTHRINGHLFHHDIIHCHGCYIQQAYMSTPVYQCPSQVRHIGRAEPNTTSKLLSLPNFHIKENQ